MIIKMAHQPFPFLPVELCIIRVTIQKTKLKSRGWGELDFLLKQYIPWNTGIVVNVARTGWTKVGVLGHRRSSKILLLLRHHGRPPSVRANVARRSLRDMYAPSQASWSFVPSQSNNTLPSAVTSNVPQTLYERSTRAPTNPIFDLSSSLSLMEPSGVEIRLLLKSLIAGAVLQLHEHRACDAL